MKNSFGIVPTVLMLFMNSHGGLYGDCHRDYLLALAQSPLLIKGRILETKGFEIKLEVVKNVWGEPQSGDINIAVFPTEGHPFDDSYTLGRKMDILKELDFDHADDADRYVFAFATKINDTLFMSMYNECGVVESDGGSVALDRFFDPDFKTVDETDFLEGMKKLHDGETARVRGNPFGDTLMQIRDNFYHEEKKEEHLWWFFLAASCVTAVQMMMFLGP